MVQADALKNLGLDELGYVFLTIDDNWSLPERHNVTGILIYIIGIQVSPQEGKIVEQSSNFIAKDEFLYFKVEFKQIRSFILEESNIYQNMYMKRDLSLECIVVQGGK